MRQGVKEVRGRSLAPNLLLLAPKISFYDVH